jgi:GPH family glycoside/pentoside/hexuronide:cation symporter
MLERMSTARQVLYATGGPGFFAVDITLGAILLFFCLPPENRGLEPQLPEVVFLGFLTAFGVATIVARGIDSIATPLIGHASDRSRSTWGRRRSFMLYGFVPMLAIPLLAYWPPGSAGSIVNAVWIGGLLCFYFVFAAMYTAPYYALVPEIARTDEERADLTRLMALVSFPMGGILMAWPIGLDLGREAGMSPTESIRWMVVALVAVGSLLCAIPLFAIDERRFTVSTPSNLSLLEAFKQTVRNRTFLIFLAAHGAFILGASLILPLTPYIATVLLGRSEGFGAYLGISLGGMLALGYAVVPALSRRFGPKRAVIACVAVFPLASGCLGLISPDTPGGVEDLRNLVLAYSALGGMGFSIAGIHIVTRVLVGQIIDADALRTGASRSAMFLGVEQAVQKYLYGLAGALIAFLFLQFGKSTEEPLGVLLVGPLAALAGLASTLLFGFLPTDRAHGRGSSPPSTPGAAV